MKVKLQGISPEEIAVRLKFSFNKNYWRNRSSWQASQPKLQQHDWWQLCPLPQEITLELAKTLVSAWEQTSNATFLNAEHNGYLCLSEGAIHHRNLSPNHNRLEVVDYLEGRGIHNLEWRLDFAPQCEVSLQSDYCIVKWNCGVLFIYLDQKVKWSTLERITTGGCFSAGFNLKEPTIQRNGNLTLNNSLDLLTHKIDEVMSKSAPIAL